ncbi:MAG: agglutinin biogenesis protein MshI [Betaproteobacteria bacterium]|nr:MAG: agglutinin biogenesis protein MshI [Betaproteobacteria bacterium]
MLDWLKGGGRTPGWLAVSFDDASLRFAHARREAGVRALVSTYGARDLGAGKGTLERLTREFKLSHYQCSTMLRAGEYDLLLVEAPNVPRAELKSALRWKVKDMVDYKIDDAILDVLDIPSAGADAAASGGPQVLAVLARNELIRSRMQQFEQARIPLSVIEIPETAQRNIAALYEEEGRGVLLLYFGQDWGLLTITHAGELYLARRLDMGVEQAEAVALEVQRTLDHFERQFAHVAVGKLLLAPTGRRTDLPETLRARFDMPVQEVDLRGVLTFGDAPPDEQAQWRLFHHFGAALRDAT